MSNSSEKILLPEQLLRGIYEVIVVGAGHAGCEAAVRLCTYGRNALADDEFG